MAQAKLLRVTEEHRVERLGARTSIEVDFRLICATNRPLESLVADGTFREDLYYRINAFAIRLPALRERPADIPVLAERFLARYCASQGLPLDARRFSPDAHDAAGLLSVARQHPRARDHRVARRAVGPRRHRARRPTCSSCTRWRPPTGPTLPVLVPLRDVERDHIRRVLDALNWNKKRAAQVLQISRETLYRKIGEFALVEEKRA